jgi:hypothetical protein
MKQYESPTARCERERQRDRKRLREREKESEKERENDYTINSMKKKMVGTSANRVEYRPTKKFLDGRVYGNGGGLPNVSSTLMSIW